MPKKPHIITPDIHQNFHHDTHDLLKERFILRGHTGSVNAVKFNGSLIVSASHDKTVRIWNGLDGTLIHIIEGFSRFVHCFDFRMSDGLLVVGTDDGSILVIDTKSIEPNTVKTHIGSDKRRQVVKCMRHSQWVTSVSFFNESDVVFASASNDGSIRVWNAKSGESIRLIQPQKSPSATKGLPNIFPLSMVALDNKILAGYTTGQIAIFEFFLSSSYLDKY